MNIAFICQYFGKNTQFLVVKKILDFRNRSYSDVSGKYQNMEKPLKHQRRLGLPEDWQDWKSANVAHLFILRHSLAGITCRYLYNTLKSPILAFIQRGGQFYSTVLVSFIN